MLYPEYFTGNRSFINTIMKTKNFLIPALISVPAVVKKSLWQVVNKVPNSAKYIDRNSEMRCSMNKILNALMALAFVAGVSLTIVLGLAAFSNSDSRPAHKLNPTTVKWSYQR